MNGVYFADCKTYHGKGISLPKDMCVSGPYLDKIKVTTALRLWTKWNKDHSGKMDGPFHKYIWAHKIELAFACHERQELVLNFYGIEIPYDVSICMPNPTIDKCRQALKRFAATLKDGISEAEKKQSETELNDYVQSHNVRLKKL